MTKNRSAKDWLRILIKYSEPSLFRSIFEIIVTAGPFIFLWFLCWASLSVGYWLTLLLSIPTAFFLLRLFVIQHDCGHQTFFRKKMANDWTGRVLSVFTITPYDLWRHAHAVHHNTSGNLSRRDLGEVTTLTVNEYESLSSFHKLRYKLYRQPAVMFGLGPSFLFLLENRVPFSFGCKGWMPWVSSMGTNLAIAILTVVMIWLVGTVPFLIVHLPIVILAGTIGVWLFYVQHQFENTYWAADHEWNMHEAALYGSSHYDLPRFLHWFTANIGIHHIHHLYSRIPFYRLPQILKDHPELANLRRLTIWESFSCIRLKLWDEKEKRLISFREARKKYRV